MRHVRISASVASLALLLGACGGGSSDDGGAAGGGNAGAAGSAGSGGAGGGAGSAGTDGGAGQGGSAGTDGGAGQGGGAGSGGGGDSGVDADGDGYTSDVDCDDANPDVHPGASETCNGVDDDCDGQTDEGVKATFYKDADQDGFGVDAAQTNLQGCVAPTGYSATAGDCDDSSAAVNPGATEICNAADDNCDGQTDEGVTKKKWYPDADGDGYGSDTGTQETCTKPNGAWATVGGDCNDGDATMFPGNTEVCDGKDNDCDASTADPSATDWYKDADGDGFGDPSQKTSACAKPSGYVSNGLDCNDANKDVNPSAVEICDGLDNNCVGGIDEGPVATYPDADKDGYGDAKAQPTYRCAADATHLADDTDCDDAKADVHPGATEIPGNSIDENCDGSDSALGTQCGPGSSGLASLPYQTTASLTAAANNKPGNPRGAGYYWDDYELATKGGETFTALMSSTAMNGIDAHLYMSANACTTSSSTNNAAWWSLHPVDHVHRSRLIVSNAAAGYYDFVTTEDAVKAGSYQFDVLPGKLGQTCGKQDLGIWPLGFRQTSTLDATDTEGAPIQSGFHAEDWEVWLDANGPYTILYSATYAPYLALSAGTNCGNATASAASGIINGKGARLVTTPAQSGIYTVWTTATTAAATGSYSINVVPGNVGESCFKGAGDLGGTGDGHVFWPVSGSVYTENLAIGDRVDTWLGQRYFDDYETWLEAGESVTFTMTTDTFTPKLMLTIAPFCTSGLVNVDPTSGKTATLTFTPTVSGIYTIIATSHGTNATGDYSLVGKYN